MVQLSGVLAASPHVDWHAFAPELILSGFILLVLLLDFFFQDKSRRLAPYVASVGVLASFAAVLTLALGKHLPREMFGGTYVVDKYSLAFKGFFLIATYIVILIGADYVEEGDYYQAEFWVLMLFSVLGLLVMSSARDLISIFVALETISIPTYVLASWRKHDRKSNEAGMKYFLIGALSSAIMLYGMSFIFGLSGSTKLSDIAGYVGQPGTKALLLIAVFFTLVGFAFKISAVPFHFWAPDTYEGAPTPVTAYLSVLSKAGGFVALMPLVLLAFYQLDNSWQPVLWALAAASMTLGNLAALRQTNVVRLLAYSSIAQGGFILVPLAVAANGNQAGTFPTSALQAVIIYLFIYGIMNLGAFGVVIAVARRTGSAEISTYDGLYHRHPQLAIAMAVFMFSLAGIPPFAGWFAKFVMFRAVLDAGTASAVTLGVIAAVNSVIAFFYYTRVVRSMIFSDPTTEEISTKRLPPALFTGLALCAVSVIAIGIFPQAIARLGELAQFSF